MKKDSKDCEYPGCPYSATQVVEGTSLCGMHAIEYKQFIRGSR